MDELFSAISFGESGRGEAGFPLHPLGPLLNAVAGSLELFEKAFDKFFCLRSARPMLNRKSLRRVRHVTTS
jgi:hypothetical protein